MRTRHEDADYVVRDGESVRVPVFLMDAVQRRVAAFDARDHQPHYAELTDEVRKLRSATRTEYLAGLQDAWRSPARRAPRKIAAADADPMRRRTEARDAYVERTCEAWRTAGRDAAQPDMGSRPEELRRRADQGETDPDAAAEIEERLERERGSSDPGADYEQYKINLSNAWRNPTGGLKPAWAQSPPNAVAAVTTPAAANKEGDVTPADVEARRRKAHAEFSERLSNAWKSR
jgi:hypothetical protein